MAVKCKILLIDEDDLKRVTVISDNVDVSLLLPFIETAQEKHIRRTVGETLYDKLLTQKNTNTLTVANELLIDDFIKQSLSQWTFYEALPFLRIRISAKGIVTKSSENTTAVSADDIGLLRREIKSNAEMYDNQLLEFLRDEDNTDNYPDFRDEESNKLNKDTYTNGGFIF